MKGCLFVLALFLVLSCEAIDQPAMPPDWDGLSWIQMDSDIKIPVLHNTIYEECYGEGNTLRLNQSMSICRNRIFCFNDGTSAHIFDFTTKEYINSKELPEYSHHNNAQFTNFYLEESNEYPLLLLSRGDYPPNKNDLYLVQVSEQDRMISFHRYKTIHNTLSEAAYNGSWVVDEDNNRLFLYTMDKGDWRVKEGNVFTIYGFKMPDIRNDADVTLGYEDVIDIWKYSYLILQGGTYYKGLLFFNVEDVQSIDGHKISCSKCVIAVDADTGRVNTYLPLFESLETEGICVYQDTLFISFRNGSQKQGRKSTVFKINKYELPTSLF